MVVARASGGKGTKSSLRCRIFDPTGDSSITAGVRARARALSTADDGPKCPLGGRSDFQLRLRAYATECANYRITIYIITVWVELSDLAGYHKFTNNIFVK